MKYYRLLGDKAFGPVIIMLFKNVNTRPPEFILIKTKCLIFINLLKYLIVFINQNLLNKIFLIHLLDYILLIFIF